MSQLPKGWYLENFANICTVIRGVTYKKNDSSELKLDGYTSLYRANNIQKSSIYEKDLVYIPHTQIKEHQLLKRGDIVVAMSSGSKSVVGKSAQWFGEHEVTFGAFCGVLRPSHVIEVKYVGYFTQTRYYRELLSGLSAGANINNLKPAYFAELEIPLAPLAEQQRIVEKLDEVLAQVDTIKARLDGIPAIIKRFRQSVLAAAVSGKLISLAQPEKIKIGDISTDIRYGTSKKCDYKGGDTPVIRIPNIGERKLDISDLKSADFTDKELDKLALLEGDLLVIRSNGSLDLVAKPALVEKKFEGFLFAGYLIRIRCDQEKVLPSFLLNVLCSRVVRDVVELGARSTSGVNNINSKELASLEFVLPTITEQKEIVRLVDQYFAFADTIEAQLKKAQARVDNLTQSILAKAFRGELVPQDPEDEPADKLLERIAEARKEAEALAKAAKKAEAAKKRAAKKAASA